MALTADQLNTIYQNVLFRNVDAGGIQFFANRTDISDAQVRQQIELSTEASTFVSPIVRLYQEVLGRLPDVGGLRFFSTQLRAGQSLDNIAQQLINSSEFQAKTTATSGSVDVTDLSNTNQLVSDAFQSILGRAPASSEFQFFSGKSPAQILSAVAGSSEAANTNAANVVTFLDSAAVGSPNSGTLNSQVNSNGTSGGGSLFTLTTGADNIAGTAGNDIINGLVAQPVAFGQPSADTLNASDSINGGSGFDILNITAGGATTTPLNGAQVTNVEAIQIRATNGAVSLDASLAPGAKFLNSNVTTSAGSVTYTNATAGTVFGDIGDGVNTTGAFTGTYAASVTAGALTLANGVKGGAVTVNGTGLTSLTVNSTSAANTVASLATSTTVKAVTINAATNLDLGTGITNLAAGTTETISGAATSVKLGASGANVTSINASGLTAGGVTVALDAGVASTFTLTGGQGTDTVSIGNVFTNAVAAGSINGGAGTDVIQVTGGNAINTATGAAFTNFETLRNAGTVQQNASVFGSTITSVQTNGSGAGFSNLTAAQAANVQILSSNAGATFALANATGTSDVLGLNLLNDSTVNTASTASTVISATGLTVTGFETLNVAAASGVTSIYQADGTTLQTPTTGIDTVSFAAAAQLKAIAVSGAFAADIDGTGATALTSFDASANTAGVIFTSGAVTGKLAITGSGGADVVTVAALGAGGSIGAVSLGAGNDLIQIAQASISASTSIDGGAGTDTLEITDTGAVTINDATFRGVSNIEKIVLDATTSLTFTTGGFANSLATSNGGTLDITAASVGNGGATIDASGLTGTNKLALNLTSTGADTITTSVGGADSITIKGAHAGAAITINGGSNTAGLTIDTSAATGATASVFNTGSGNDTIKVGAFTATLNTGTGSDNVTLTAADGATQTFTLTTNGVSSTSNALNVTNFSLANANSDVLDFATTGVLTNVQVGNGFSVSNGIATKSGATLADFVSAVATSTTAGSAAFVVNGDTYVAYSDGSSSVTGADHLVHLIGVTATAVGTAAATGTVVIA